MAVYLELFAHAAACPGSEEVCQQPNCKKTGNFFVHARSCPDWSKCRVCAKFVPVFLAHGRTCKLPRCPVPRCFEIREKIRNNEIRQQQMDRERRELMNSIYYTRK